MSQNKCIKTVTNKVDHKVIDIGNTYVSYVTDPNFDVFFFGGGATDPHNEVHSCKVKCISKVCRIFFFHHLLL